MSKMVIDSSTLHDIGNAIRSKENSTAAIPVTRLASRISEIETGIQLPTLSTPASSAHILHGYQALDGSGSMITGSIPLQQGVTITPGANAQGIEANRYLTGALTVLGDSDLVPGNIKKGVSIFNVAGSYEGEVKTIAKGQLVSCTGSRRYVTIEMPEYINGVVSLSILITNDDNTVYLYVYSPYNGKMLSGMFSTVDDVPGELYDSGSITVEGNMIYVDTGTGLGNASSDIIHYCNIVYT